MVKQFGESASHRNARRDNLARLLWPGWTHVLEEEKCKVVSVRDRYRCLDFSAAVVWWLVLKLLLSYRDEA